MYVPYIKNENLSGLFPVYQDRIQVDEPRTLEDIVQKAKYCYEQSKHKAKFWTD